MQIQTTTTIPDREVLAIVEKSPEIQAMIAAKLTGKGAVAKPAAKHGAKPAIEPPPTKRGKKAAPKSTPRPKSNPAGKGTKRDPAVIEEMSKAFVEHVRSNPGQRMEEIVNAIGFSTKALQLPVKKAMAAGTICTRGTKRATAYYPRGAAAEAAE